ncbi:MAG: HDIG domain-containing protein [Paludibacteraceae bacterium]|nr:HDIG domain-containing protein [Paludibacteraceae bacterium]
MNPAELIEKYYNKYSKLYEILMIHSESVANKALAIAEAHPEFNLDKDFLFEASMLHDIGIFKTDAPGICCTGTEPYIRHGQIGAEIVRNEGYEKHALVCERHTGVGLTRESIAKFNLPIKMGDYFPVSMEEKVICFADKFYSKTKLYKEKTLAEARRSIERFGEDQVAIFDEWCKMFL